MKNTAQIKEVAKITKSDRYVDLTGFEMQDKLNSRVWDNGGKLRPEIRKNLLKIADDYIESLGIENLDIEDVTFTGSLANYNWSQYSDVDLHILIDYDEVPVDESLIQDFLKSKSTSWNQNHDVKIYGYDVELYVQDINEEHVSTGVYSILNNEWLIKPEKKRITVDDKNVKLKSNRIMDSIDDLYDEMKKEKNYEIIVEKADKIKDKIKKMRQAGLDKSGEFSVENLVFKVLRRNGMLDRLSDIKTVAYDKSVTLENNRYLFKNILK
jgi:gas vesicle protein